MTQNLEQKWQSLTLANDFIFGKVMSRPNLCKKLLERIFPELNITRIEYPELQKTIVEDIDAKSVRLDVYVKDDQETIYNIEIQTTDTKELPKRSRYYQSMIDLQLIDKGEVYRNLNKSYVIFICVSDIFHKGRHKYTFQNTCTEDPSLVLGDEAVKIFLNTKGTMKDIDPKLKAVLDYIDGIYSDDPYVEELDNAVTEAKRNREWRREYMTLAMKLNESYDEGRKEGIDLGKIYGAVSVYKDLGFDDNKILENICAKFQLTEKEALEYLK